MRLIKLKDTPVRIEGKYGTVTISQDKDSMTFAVAPDTGCEGSWHIDTDGCHIIRIEKNKCKD